MADDGALLLAWRDGDAAAGNELFLRHFPALWRFFRSKVGEEAEDLIQRTMLACVRSRDRVHADGFRAYLFRTARNELVDHYRRSSAHARHFEPVEHSLHDVSPLASAALMEHEEQKVLLAALRQLPLDVQLTMELYYWEGLRHSELSAVLGVTPEAIKKRLQRGRAQLRELIEQIADEAVVTSTMTQLEDWARSLRNCIESPEHAGRGTPH